MFAYFEFVTLPTADTPGTTILLHYDSKRYMIGRVGEGTQRAWIERGIGKRKVEHIFLTGKTSSESIGGVLGMVLTLADSIAASDAQRMETSKKRSKESRSQQREATRPLNIHGGANLAHAVATARRFIFRKGIPLNVREVKHTSKPKRDDSGELSPTWLDENIRVWTMVIKPEESMEVESPTLNARKRTFDQLNGIEPNPNLANCHTDGNSSTAYQEAEAAREARYDALRQGVVNDMFGSNWTLDCMVETPLSEVNLPAKIWVRDSKSKILKEYSGPLPGGKEPIPDPDLKVLVRTPWPGALISALPPTKPKEEAISYIIGTWPRRGKFLRQKAEELGVPKGKQFGLLAGGQSITLQDGRVITPEMVLEETRPARSVAIIDLPGTEYVKPLVEREEWKSLSIAENLKAVIWILGSDVAENKELKKFMESHSNLEHIIASPDVCPNELAFESSASSAIRLAQLDITNFPIPNFDNRTVPQSSFRSFSDGSTTQLASNQIARRGLRVIMEPEFEIRTDRLAPQFDALQQLGETDQEYVHLAHSALSSMGQEPNFTEIEGWKATLPDPGSNVEIITLGTGSALPSKYRNVSATLICVPGFGNYLLDCGENTLGQLQRTFKPQDLREVLKNLRMIWISHLHADHHLGTVSVIKAWHEVVHGVASKTPSMSPNIANSLLDSRNSSWRQGQLELHDHLPYLAIVSDAPMLHYLSEYSYVEDFGYKHILPLAISSAKVEPTQLQNTSSVLTLSHNNFPVTVIPRNLYPTLLGVKDIQAVHVTHCRGAKAIALTFPSSSKFKSSHGFKLAYSGDSRPSKAFTVIGRDATVLIHEATFDDDLQEEAVAKRHSTTSEALKVGAEMRAKSVVLTHFSQRYQKIPVLDSANFGVGLQDVVDAEKDEEMETGQNGVVSYEDEIRDVEELPGMMSGQFVSLAGDFQEEQRTEPQAGDEFGAPMLHSTDDAKPEYGELLDASMIEAPDLDDNIVNKQQDTKEREEMAKHMKICVAFDYMRVKVGDIPKMAALRPALLKLFEDEVLKEESASRKSSPDRETVDKIADVKAKSKRQQKKLAKKRSKEALTFSDAVEK
jgi:ribonuclease Z